MDSESKDNIIDISNNFDSHRSAGEYGHGNYASAGGHNDNVFNNSSTISSIGLGCGIYKDLPYIEAIRCIEKI